MERRLLSMGLERMYRGPAELTLDSYTELPAELPHGQFFRVGAIARLAHAGLAAELWECRMPSRFYKAVVSRANGMAVGTFATGSGLEAGTLLVETCRALAAGFATLEPVPGGATTKTAPDVVALSGTDWQSNCLLRSSDTTLVTQVAHAVMSGMLSFEPATE
jgi:hypothetical protein